VIALCSPFHVVGADVPSQLFGHRHAAPHLDIDAVRVGHAEDHLQFAYRAADALQSRIGHVEARHDRIRRAGQADGKRRGHAAAQEVAAGHIVGSACSGLAYGVRPRR
jgi:hypothetical protein